MLDGPSMIRVGNTAYMDLDMLGLQGPVSAEVTGKLQFNQNNWIICYNLKSITRYILCRSRWNNYTKYID